MIYKVIGIKDCLAQFGLIKTPAKKAVLKNNHEIKEVVIEKPSFSPKNYFRYDGQCPREDWIRVGMDVVLYHDKDGEYVVKYNKQEL